ncbi:MAG: hypothetical protein AAF386_03440 [Pseudomonadota bacterium]
MNMLWILRMARVLRNPPSKERVMLILAVVGMVALLVGAETFGLWPDWLQVNNNHPRGAMPKGIPTLPE